MADFRSTTERDEDLRKEGRRVARAVYTLIIEATIVIERAKDLIREAEKAASELN